MVKSLYYKLSELETILDPSNPVYFDIETDGLYGKIVLSQFYQEGMNHVILVKNPDPFLLAIIIDNYKLIMHNASYEISTIQRQSNTTWVPKHFEDTIYLSRLHFYKKSKFSLGYVMSYVLGNDPYAKESLDKSKIQKSDWSGILSQDQILYASIDVFHLVDVYNIVKVEEITYSYKLDMKTLRHCLSFQNNGMPVLQKNITLKIQKNKSRLGEIALPINSNSYVQVRGYIEEDESDALALTKYALLGNRRAGRVQETRKLLKNNNYLGKYDVDYVYGVFLPSARSGRLTCSKQNLQQIPRNLRDCFGYIKGDGSILVSADYPAIELRCITAIAGEHRMAKMFVKNEDIHGNTASFLFGNDWTKEQRRIAKNFNFNLLYGGGAEMAQSIILKDAGIFMTLRDVLDKKKQWHKFWPDITKWQRRTINKWKEGETASTPLGRKYIGTRCTDHLNIMVQGFAAEIAKLALHRLMYAISKLDSRIKLLNFIHDNYVLSCPDDEDLYKELCVVLAKSMQQAWFESQVNLKIANLPMPIEVFVGYNWGSLEFDYIHKHTANNI